MEGPGARYVLGMPEMDDQHTYLYCLFDAIPPAPREARGDLMARLMDEIERYLLFHFESEELLMRRYGFPGFALHQADHESAGRRFVRFQNDFENGDLNSAALKIFLTGWLMDHSKASDAEYVAWVKKMRAHVMEPPRG